MLLWSLVLYLSILMDAGIDPSALLNCPPKVKMMMVRVIARTIGLHHLILLKFYPYLHKYVQPHQRDITNLLATAVQACHDMLMTEDLLQDLVLQRESHEKAVSLSSHSFLTLFREAKKEARTALTQHGFKLPSSDQLSLKRVDAAELEANIKKKLTKEERLALIRAGREERGTYQSWTAVKQKKAGDLSNQQKEEKKAMPLAKRAKIAKTRQEKKKQQQRSCKQFRGRNSRK